MKESDKDHINGVSREYILKQAEAYTRKPSPEEIETASLDIQYPGRRVRTITKVIQAPGKFFGIKVGPVRIGVWVEH